MASATQTAQKRKRPAKACPNPLFEKWLEEWKKEAQDRGLNSVHTYRKALNSLRQYPLPLRNGQEAKQLPNFGDTLARKLDKKIQEHNNTLNADSQDGDKPEMTRTVKESTRVPDVPPATVRQEPTSPVKKKRKINRQYVPLPRSGGYAILITLLKADQTLDYGGFMLKKDLLKDAQPFCDASLTVPEPGSHYTAWSSMSTLIKKQLVTKSATTPAKYMLTEAGLELAKKLVQAGNSVNGSSPDCVGSTQHPKSSLQNTRNSEPVPPGRDKNFKLQEDKEDLESRLPKPWLLCQEDGNLPNASKISSISSQEKLTPEQEVIASDSEPWNSESSKSPINYKNNSISLASSGFVLPGNSKMHNSVQLDELSPQFWYVDNEDNLVHEKNKAAILFDSDSFSTNFLVKAIRKSLDSAGWLYTIDHSRSYGAGEVYAYISDLDAPELCTPPSNRVLSPLPSHHGRTTTSSSCSALNGDISIVTLSSDSEDELPSLSQRIGLINNTSSFKTYPVNGGLVEPAVGKGKEKQGSLSSLECRIVIDDAASTSCMIKQPAVSKSSSSNIPTSSTADIMTIAHDEAVTMPMRPTKGQIIRTTSNCNIIGIHDNDSPTSMSQQSQNSPVASSSTNKNLSSVDHSSCSRLTLKPGEYEVFLYIDNVEANNKSNMNGVLMAGLTKNGINCKVCKLQVGDFLWVARKSSAIAGPPLELVLDHIIERKRMDDLCNSIIDRRFSEQKFRLTNCGIHHVIYLIEEYGDPSRFSIPASSLFQAITNTQIINGFYIRRTQNIKDTVAYLTTMTRCLQKHYSGATLEEHSVECITSGDQRLMPQAVSSGDVISLMSFTAFSAASVKNKVMTVTEMFAKHLIQIPGFSAEKAEAVIAQFPTPTSLFKAYSQCSPPEKRPLLLEHIKYGRRNRNLGRSLSMLVNDLYWSGHLSSS